MRPTLKILLSLILIISGACRTSKFNADDKAKPLETTIQPIILPCLKDTPITVPIKVSGTSKTQIVLRGEICPSNESIYPNKTVLIVVDQSASMQNTDPTEGSSCARLAAVRSMVQKIKSSEKAPDNVILGLIGFSNSAETLLQPQQVYNIENSMNRYEICRSSGYTNYEAAFDKAKKTLQLYKGDKEVYLISDGFPDLSPGTSPEREGLSPENAGKQAADQLTSDSNLYVLFLSKPGYQDGQTKDPRNYLESLTGNPSRVKVVEQTESLANEIIEFDVQPPKSVTNMSPSVILKSEGFKEKVIKVTKIGKHSNKQNVWAYESAPFIPNSIAGQGVKNNIQIHMLDNLGRPYSAEINIQYAN